MAFRFQGVFSSAWRILRTCIDVGAASTSDEMAKKMARIKVDECILALICDMRGYVIEIVGVDMSAE